MGRSITRRTFLGAGGGAAAAALGLAPARAQTSGPVVPGRPAKRAIRKAVKLSMVAGDEPIVEKFRMLRGLGYAGVEIEAPNALDADEVVAARDIANLRIHGVVDSEHWRSPLSDPDPQTRARGRAALETALRVCRRYGGTTVLLVPGVVTKQVSYADAYRRSQEEIRAVLPLAAELGVRIAFENVWNQFLLSPLEAARYVDEFESPWVGWYLDVGNVVNYGWPEQWVRILDRRILKVDVKEFSRAKRDAEGLWKGFDADLFEGDCDWPAVMQALDEIRYRGWITAEMRGGDRERLRKIAEGMDRIVGSDGATKRRSDGGRE